MQVLLLCGGRGVIDQESHLRIPKGMMVVGDQPVLRHIMKSFAAYGHTRFILALGEGDQHIRRYFLEYGVRSHDIEIELAGGDVKYLNRLPEEEWRVKLVDTGLQAQTGSRIARCRRYLETQTFFISYSDCLCDVNLAELMAFHQAHGKLLTVTGVQPPTRFGTFFVEQDAVVGYALQQRLTGKGGYMNGGYMVAEPALLDYLEPYSECNLENEVFARLASEGQVAVYSHSGYWQAVDTERDLLVLNTMYKNNERPWLPRPSDFK